jgi:hypothetical protein
MFHRDEPNWDELLNMIFPRKPGGTFVIARALIDKLLANNPKPLWRRGMSADEKRDFACCFLWGYARSMLRKQGIDLCAEPLTTVIIENRGDRIWGRFETELRICAHILADIVAQPPEDGPGVEGDWLEAN